MGGNQQLALPNGDRHVRQQIGLLLLLIVLGFLLLFRSRRHGRHIAAEVDVGGLKLRIFLFNHFPNDLAVLDVPPYGRVVLSHPLLHGCLHGFCIRGLHGEQQPLAGGIDGQVVVGQHRDAVAEVSDQLVAQVKVRPVRIRFQSVHRFPPDFFAAAKKFVEEGIKIVEGLEDVGIQRTAGGNMRGTHACGTKSFSFNNTSIFIAFSRGSGAYTAVRCTSS